MNFQMIIEYELKIINDMYQNSEFTEAEKNLKI